MWRKTIIKPIIKDKEEGEGVIKTLVIKGRDTKIILKIQWNYLIEKQFFRCSNNLYLKSRKEILSLVDSYQKVSIKFKEDK